MDDLLASIRKIIADETEPARGPERAPRASGRPPRHGAPSDVPSRLERAMTAAVDPQLSVVREALREPRPETTQAAGASGAPAGESESGSAAWENAKAAPNRAPLAHGDWGTDGHGPSVIALGHTARDDADRRTMPRENADRRTMPRENADRRAMPRDDADRRTMPREEADGRTMPREDADRRTADRWGPPVLAEPDLSEPAFLREQPDFDEDAAAFELILAQADASPAEDAGEAHTSDAQDDAGRGAPDGDDPHRRLRSPEAIADERTDERPVVAAFEAPAHGDAGASNHRDMGPSAADAPVTRQAEGDTHVAADPGPVQCMEPADDRLARDIAAAFAMDGTLPPAGRTPRPLAALKSKIEARAARLALAQAPIREDAQQAEPESGPAPAPQNTPPERAPRRTEPRDGGEPRDHLWRAARGGERTDPPQRRDPSQRTDPPQRRATAPSQRRDTAAHPPPERTVARTPRAMQERPDDLISQRTRESVVGAFDQLSRTGQGTAAPRSLEDLVCELMRPMLREWLDDNLPHIVERTVRAEIDRLTPRPR